MIREWEDRDLPALMTIWNQVVSAGRFFPDKELLDLDGMRRMTERQVFTGVAEEDGRVQGLYILHPNGIGRCAHVANCGYMVAGDARGRGIGRQLVCHSLAKAGELGFAGVQFNAVVASNTGAIALYESLGFRRLGTVPGGYLTDAGPEDMHIYFHATEQNGSADSGVSTVLGDDAASGACAPSTARA
ncbi:GNAT family N-acetyltransferase [Adlercreutzia murintestinalis]|uniref:GNAT family N-acetyltransferase n=1 Tax=Adlercreutzia murintestinalis TaxID=2941325 RepID=UPI00203FA03F|nr:GNAT family N-acetyltransferase [Adlercreutzia murintestinalis]